MTEHTLQLEIIAWFRNEFERHGKGLIIPIINEASYKDKTFVIHKGASDLLIVINSKCLFVELKVGYNKQSLDQEVFESNINKLNHYYFVCRSLNGFKQIMYETTN